MRIERAGAAPKASAAVVVLLTALSGVPAAAAEPPHGAPVFRNHVDSMTRAALERAGEGALRRLQDPECQLVFSDFKDAEGRPLREKLEAAGQTGAGYLSSRILFADGSGARACQSSDNLAVTNPGSAVVFVCARQFRERVFRDPAWVEAALIHEELHSLGLGENPPSSLEINEQVARRCGRR
jgi:microcompartment protein CcmK/EutM